MKEVMLPKQEALRIALSIVSGRIDRKEFGYAALRETELILKNIIETEEVALEIAAKPPLEPKKPNKKRALTPAQKKVIKVNKFAEKELIKNVTILDLEEGK